MITQKQTNNIKRHSGILLAALGIVFIVLLACEGAGGGGGSGTNGNGVVDTDTNDGRGGKGGVGEAEEITSFLSVFKTTYQETIADGTTIGTGVEIIPIPYPKEDNKGNAITYSILTSTDKPSFNYDATTSKLFYTGSSTYDAAKNIFTINVKASLDLPNQPKPDEKIITLYLTVANSNIDENALLTKITTGDTTRNTITMDELMVHFDGINKYLPIADYRNALAGAADMAEAQTALNLVSANLSRKYKLKATFNNDISDMDTSKVTNMEEIFGSAYVFNQSIGNWDVSSVTNMHKMFYSITKFDKAIGKWDVSKVTNMSNMFNNSLAFNQAIGKWDVSSVTNMKNMFEGANSFDQDLSDWNISALTSAYSMFRSSGISSDNLDLTLHGWAQLNKLAGEDKIPLDVNFINQDKTMKNATAFYKLQLKHGWDMSGDFTAIALKIDSAVISGTFDGTDWDKADDLGNATETNPQKIHGLGGNDTITGGSGDDILAPGAGDDTITTGDGHDTIMLYYVEDGKNTITDFKIGTGGDTINASLLFMTARTKTVYFADKEIRAKYVKIANEGGNVKLIFHASGGITLPSGTTEPDVSVILERVLYTDVGTAGSDEAYLDTLIADGNLVLQ